MLGRYHLLLAHEVLAAPAEYMKFWQNLPAPAPFIIMDNSLIELGHPVSGKELLTAADIVGAQVIVLPDVLGDRFGTYRVAAQAVEEIHQYIGPKPKLLGVAQGQTLVDIFSCGRDLVKQFGLDYISVPRHVVGRVGSRTRLTGWFCSLGKMVHLLGFSDNLFDDVNTAVQHPVLGIDSAMPIWLGQAGIYVPKEIGRDWDAYLDDGTSRFGRPSDYATTTTVNDAVIENIKRVRGWLEVPIVGGAPIETSPGR